MRMSHVHMASEQPVTLGTTWCGEHPGFATRVEAVPEPILPDVEPTGGYSLDMGGPVTEARGE